ncbi:bile acid acyltransferase/acyl-CoA thioester hydrolase-like protein [Arenibacter echinorum]|uniref:Bile acid acyltransferase/acyl-CoA thioester hydrolase-like protein n=2 Tax=Arenibacter echinorum TaxID=440515 RepID=A0A327QJS8_9FLAO|nr:bile acid acyltransferase/acyl-CoA thioester hydrolase-like protein [Arenibacter echinorum]
MKKNRKYIIWIGIIAILFVGYFIVDSFLFNGVKPKIINDNGFQANYFVKKDTEKKASIVLIGGGQWGDYWGQQFANRGFSGLSLPYTRRAGLPKLPEEINLEYFEKALAWLKKQPEVDPNKIIVMGASRNAELSLVIASIFPNLVGGVIAFAPSSVSWSNTVLPYNSNDLKPSWKYQGIDIPYIPMDKISGNESNKIETLEYWKSGLAKIEFLTHGTIKAEKINGPILLFSGKDDRVWPSSVMADMIEQRIKENNFKYSFQNIKYEEAGHLISSNPESNSDPRTGIINIDGKDYEFEYGGTNEGDYKAKKDTKRRLLYFIEKL